MRRSHAVIAAGEGDDLVKQLVAARPAGDFHAFLRDRRGGQKVQRHRAGRLAQHSDIVGIAAKGRGIALEPAQPGDQVHQPVIAAGLVARFGRQLGIGHIA